MTRQLEDIATRCAIPSTRRLEIEWHKPLRRPWNRCTADTLRALDELGFAVLSRDESESSGAGRRFCEIPVTFDIFTWKKGAALKSESDIAAGIAAQVRAGNRIGILLHHKVMTPDAFRSVASLLNEFRRSPAVQTTHIRQSREVATSRGAEPMQRLNRSRFGRLLIGHLRHSKGRLLFAGFVLCWRLAQRTC